MDGRPDWLTNDGQIDDWDLTESEDDTGAGALADSMVSHMTAGDVMGIAKGRGESIIVTQPALDDVDSDFFPDPATAHEDHIDSHEFGHVHASSGIRRWERDGILHEIDWALLKIKPERLQPYNLVQGGRRFCQRASWDAAHPIQRDIARKLSEPVHRRHYTAREDEFPNRVAAADELAGLRVHCFGRTSGLKGGVVGSALSSVRIYRRTSFSRSWPVLGDFGGSLPPLFAFSWLL